MHFAMSWPKFIERIISFTNINIFPCFHVTPEDTLRNIMAMWIPRFFDPLENQIEFWAIQVAIPVAIQNVKKFKHFRNFMVQGEKSTVENKMLFFTLLILENVKKSISFVIARKLHPQFLLKLFKQDLKARNSLFSHWLKLLFPIWSLWKIKLFEDGIIIISAHLIHNFGQLFQIKFLALRLFPWTLDWIFGNFKEIVYKSLILLAHPDVEMSVDIFELLSQHDIFAAGVKTVALVSHAV